MIKFDNFVFNENSKTLHKHNNLVELTETQLRLFLLFLDNPEIIFSKEDILEALWRDKNVTEQVVFQTISQLRALLGSQSIKTFPKRGYQWQYKLSKLANTELNIQNNSHVSSLSSVLSTRSKRYKLSLITLVVVISLILLLFILIKPEAGIKPRVNALEKQLFIPFSSIKSDNEVSAIKIKKLNDRIVQALIKEDSLNKVNNIDSNQFFTSPFLSLNSMANHNSDLMFSGFLRKITISHERFYYLEYQVQGNYRNWRSFILAKDIDILSERFLSQFSHITSSRYFKLASDAHTTAELLLLNEKFPYDLAISAHLVKRLIIEQNHDRASAVLGQLSSLSLSKENPIYEGISALLKGQLLTHHAQIKQAKQSLLEAEIIFESIENLALQSSANQSLAKLAAKKGHFESIKQYLEKSALLARYENRPKLELKSYYQLSKYAAIFKNQKEQFIYMGKVKLLLQREDIDESHAMLNDYHEAIFAETVTDKLYYLEKALEKPVTLDNSWIFYAAIENALDIYLTQQDWAALEVLTNRIADHSLRAMLMAKVYYAKNKPQLAWQQATEAFDTARVALNYWHSVPTALFLLELDHANSIGEKHEYRQHITLYASPSWKSRHEKQLAAVGIYTSDLAVQNSNSLGEATVSQ